MSSITQFLSSTPVAFLLSCLLVVVLRSQAGRLGLIDKPGGRKQHSGSVPIIGGVAVYFSVVITGLLFGFGMSFFLPLLLAVPIVVVGVMDDHTPISPVFRIPVQIMCAAAMMYFGGVQISNIGDITGSGQVALMGIWCGSLAIAYYEGDTECSELIGNSYRFLYHSHAKDN